MKSKKYVKSNIAIFEKQNNGFTLAELLVVVAIIAIIVAISIPIFTSKLDAARAATCDSNCRSLKAEISVDLLNGEGVPGLVGTSISNAALRANYGNNFDFETFCPSGGEISAEVTNATSEGTGTVHIYCSEHHPKQPVYDAWVSSKNYAVGDLMTSGNYIFRCIRAHTSGDTQYTRNPVDHSNKNTWEMVGTADGSIPGYSSVIRYAEGVVVTANQGKKYSRTSYSPTSSPTPFDGSSYWTLLE